MLGQPAPLAHIFHRHIYPWEIGLVAQAEWVVQVELAGWVAWVLRVELVARAPQVAWVAWVESVWWAQTPFDIT